MTQREPSQRAWPGLSAMLLLVTLLTGVGFVLALRRTADVDDSAIGAASNAWPDMRIDVNSAGLSELSLLPGLGDRLAQRILDEREARGPFATLDDLDRVSGMGAGTIERLRPYAFVATP